VQVVEISDNIFIVFPLIKEAFYEVGKEEKMIRDAEKTLGLDNTKNNLY